MSFPRIESSATSTIIPAPAARISVPTGTAISRAFELEGRSAPAMGSGHWSGRTTESVGAAAAAAPTGAAAAAAPTDSVVRPDQWPLPIAGALLPSSSKALEIAVPVGTEIRAAGAGMIVEVADDSILGKLIRISHRSGYETIYGGANEVHVSQGQHVSAGTVIALSGNAPGTLEPHLHFEMRRHGVAIDASSVIKKGPGHGDLQ